MSYFDNVKAVSFVGKAVKKLELAGKIIWEAISFKNWVPYSTTEDGVTIYNGGLGYKEGTRIRSGGAEASTTTSTCTGFIPVQPLSVVRVAGTIKTFAVGGNSQAVNVYDASFTVLGQIAGTSNYGVFQLAKYLDYNVSSVVERGNYWEWVVPPAFSGIAYIRVTGYTMEGENLIVTIDEEIE